MRPVAAILLTVVATSLSAQTVSTLCQAKEVAVTSNTIDLQLIGCGEGFSDNLLWHLDRADSRDGSLDRKSTRRATGKGAVVYMCDTGVMRDHDEFARATGSVVIDYIAANGIAQQCPGVRNPALDPCWPGGDGILAVLTHGTATASVVAGRTVGIAPDASIVSVYMENIGTDIDGWIRTFDAIIQHAWNPATPAFKTGIINMSFAPNLASAKDARFPSFERKMREMIAGVDANGNPDPSGKRFLFVAAAGNSETGPGNQCDAQMNSNVYPGILGSSIDGLITVGGIDESNHVWDRSCRGAAVDVLAPASNLLVASISAHDHYRSGHALNGGYPPNSGTSYAAPYVAGLAALLLEKNPNLTPEQLEERIKNNASRTANADEPTASGRVAVFDSVFEISGRRAGRR